MPSVKEDYEEKDEGLGVTYRWHNSTIVERIRTRRGTLVELVDRPAWGLTCYMDGVIQSCEKDQAVYHKALVNNGLSRFSLAQEKPFQVCLFGGGEGATAARLLQSILPIESVRMIEWDEEVVGLFRDRFRSWSVLPGGDSAWSSPRLRLEHGDAFTVCNEAHEGEYRLVLVDLFDVDEDTVEKMEDFVRKTAVWSSSVYGMYVATHSPFVKPSDRILRRLRAVLASQGFTVKLVSVYVPSFHGHAVFLYGRK
jgi:predicted membrane-bound spermidine synthase